MAANREGRNMVDEGERTEREAGTGAGRSDEAASDGTPLNEMDDAEVESDSGGGGARAEGEPARSPLADVQELINDVLVSFKGFSVPGRSPRYDLMQDEGAYHLLVDLPGMSKQELRLRGEGDTLTVSGKRRRPEQLEGSETLRSERGFGSFRRTIRLPADVDWSGIRARMEAGVLHVRLPRRAEGGKQTIDIEE